MPTLRLPVRLTLTTLALAAMAALPARVQAQPAALKAQYLRDIDNLGSKFTELAGAMGADTYSWRPMEGVRSVSEVYMLLATEWYVVPTFWGAAPAEGIPAGNDVFGALAKVTAKDEVATHLQKSLAHFKAAVSALTDEDMGKTIKFFGQDRTVSAALYSILTDMHEHLGQAIAYARMNKVVPPWTARRQQKG